MSKVYVTGASGRLGRAVMERLPEAVPLVRKSSGLKNEITTDFSSESLKKILADAKAVIHLAGSRDFLDLKKAREGNVMLTKRIVENLPKEAKMIYSSSISVYGKQLAKIPADENTPERPDTPYAKTKLEAEGIVIPHQNHVILRIGPVYGSGFEEYFKILNVIQKNKMSIVGDGNNHIPFVHVEDVVTAIMNSLEEGKGIYVIVGECIPQKEVYEIAARELDVPAPHKHLNVTFATLFAHFELFRTSRFGGKPKFIPEDIAVLSSDRVFDCSKAKQEIGFSPRPLEEGIREMVQQYKTYKS